MLTPSRLNESINIVHVDLAYLHICDFDVVNPIVVIIMLIVSAFQYYHFMIIDNDFELFFS